MAGLSEGGQDGAGPGLLFADGQLLVLDKPAGLLAVPGRGPGKADCASARMLGLYPDARVVHRLDMATSGLLLMARGDAAQRTLSAAFEQRRVGKRYQAVVAGRLDNAAGADPQGWACIDLPLAGDWPRRPLQKVDLAQGRPSRTRWRVLGHEAGGTRLELEPLTGRSHQLRVHLQAIGHPILGDTLYAPPAQAQAAHRLLLHACELSFAHPASGEPLHFALPPPF